MGSSSSGGGGGDNNDDDDVEGAGAARRETDGRSPERPGRRCQQLPVAGPLAGPWSVAHTG